MKICQIIPVLGTGGAEKMCADLSLEFKRKGHEVIVISLYHEPTHISRVLAANNVRVYYLNKKKGFDLNCIISLRNLINLIKPDIVHTHLYSLKYAFISCIGFHIPIIHTIHNVAEKEQGKNNRYLCYCIYKLKYATPVALSKEIQKTVINYYKLESDNVPIIHNGICLSNFNKKNDYTLHSPCRIIHVGRFQEQKNHFCILSAAKLLSNKDVKFICLGDGELKEQIEIAAKKSKIDDMFEFLGVSNNVSHYLYNSDIFILPSKWEGLPISVLEAMAVGIPIIASNVGGVGDLISSENNGLLIEPNPNELADSINKLINDKFLRETIGKKASIDSKRYSVEKMAERYLSLYTIKINKIKYD